MKQKKTPEEIRAAKIENGRKGGLVKNPRKGFGSNREAAAKALATRLRNKAERDKEKE